MVLTSRAQAKIKMNDRSTQHKSKIKVNCPECKKQIPWDSSNPHRPFCSERCKLLDLGAWADGSRVIAGKSDELDSGMDHGAENPFNAQNDESIY